MIGFPNRIDTATLSGGSWRSSLPVTNLQQRTIGRVARSTNAALTSTQFSLDFGRQRQVQVFALVNNNISTAGKYRLRGSDDSTFTTTDYDSGWVDVWPVIYPYPVLEWEDDRWWSGKYLEEDLAGSYRNLIILLPSVKYSRYWKLEVDDTNNSAGYIQAGRVFFGPGWVPSKNPSFDLELGWETTTDVQEALGGAETFDRRLSFRSTRFTLDYMGVDEALSRAFDMDRQAGIDQEVLWVQDTADTTHQYRRRFLGRLRQLSPIKYPYYNTNSKAYEIKELL